MQRARRPALPHATLTKPDAICLSNNMRCMRVAGEGRQELISWGAGVANKLLAPLVPPVWSAIWTALIFMALRDSLLRRPNALRRTVVVSLVQIVIFVKACVQQSIRHPPLPCDWVSGCCRHCPSFLQASGCL